MSRTALQSAAFCLHVRPYRESSVLAQLFTEDFGRIPVIAKGIKTAKKSKSGQAALLQPFVPLSVRWVGRGDLKTLTEVEAVGEHCFLKEKALLSGMYLNELLCALLPDQLEHKLIYSAYAQALASLKAGDNLEICLRRFEALLLEHLGYGIAFIEVDESGHACGEIISDRDYRYVSESGFIQLDTSSQKNSKERFSGGALLCIAEGNYDSPEVLSQAKRLMRLALSSLLGEKQLNSRLLFS